MIQQAVIIAAGKGSRIRTSAGDLPKPLQRVAGTTLLKRTILTLAQAGVDRVVVVVGFMGDLVRRVVQSDTEFAMLGVRIEVVENPDYEKANGVSVLAAREHVDEAFLLSMADHVYDVKLPHLAAASDMALADLYLATDSRVSEVYDIDDATKVRTHLGHIVDIGKEIPEYDCIDCGVFAVTPRLMDVLDDLHREHGDCALSDGVRCLAAEGRAGVFDIGDAFWQDVDTQDARQRAEFELRRRGAVYVPSAAWRSAQIAAVAAAEK